TLGRRLRALSCSIHHHHGTADVVGDLLGKLVAAILVAFESGLGELAFAVLIGAQGSHSTVMRPLAPQVISAVYRRPLPPHVTVAVAAHWLFLSRSISVLLFGCAGMNTWQFHSWLMRHS